MKNLAVYLLLFIVFSGFNPKNITSELNSEVYLKEIPFTFEYGIPIIKAKINNKEFNFLFDTGMPTALSENLVERLDLNAMNSKIGSDVNGNKQRESYVTLKKISVGGIDFENIETLSVDLNSVFEIGCINIDGVIGNNIIQNGIWEIDYERKLIKFTNDIDNFNIPSNANKIYFKYNSRRNQLTPKIDIKINNKKLKGILFDTGSTAGIKLPLKQFKKIHNLNQNIEYYGKASAALYGKGEDIQYIDSKIKTIEIDDLKLQNKIVTFYENSPLIGNRFLKNYRIILNYEKSEIYMIEQNDYSYTSLQNFGFRTSVIDNKNIVSILYKNSNAEQNGILLGDEVLEINDINIRYLIAEDACNFLFNNPLKDLKSMNLLILRGEERHSIVLETETFIE
jgi:hypothetical protein